MHAPASIDDYMSEIRRTVCSRCIDRPPDGPPCGPVGKRCGIELHLPELVDIVHGVHSARIDPYIDNFHGDICTVCENRTTSQCPCPLEYLLTLAVEAIERVDRQTNS